MENRFSLISFWRHGYHDRMSSGDFFRSWFLLLLKYFRRTCIHIRFETRYVCYLNVENLNKIIKISLFQFYEWLWERSTLFCYAFRKTFCQNVCWWFYRQMTYSLRADFLHHKRFWTLDISITLWKHFFCQCHSHS